MGSNRTRAARMGALVTIALALLLAAPPAARAYVQARVRAGAAMHWTEAVKTLTLVSAAPTTFTDEAYEDAVAQAANAWTTSSVGCTRNQIRIVRAPAGDATVGIDGRNIVVFRAPEWCRPDPANPKGPPDCSATSVLALTTAFADAKSGRILEADIEINGAQAAWSDLGAEMSEAHDLQNALTHELGHFLGFAHSCLSPGEVSALTDDRGAPLSACAHANDEQIESTMFPRSETGDLDLRTLSEDDERGVCDVYPRGAGDPLALGDLTLNPDRDVAGCRVGQGGPPSWWLLGAVALAAASARRRPRRR